MTADVFYLLRDADGDLTVPAHTEASWLLIRLEARGITVTVDGAHLAVHPKGALTAAERDALVRLKPHVRHLLAYQPPGVH